MAYHSVAEMGIDVAFENLYFFVLLCSACFYVANIWENNACMNIAYIHARCV